MNGTGGPPPVPFGMPGSVTHRLETATSALTVDHSTAGGHEWDHRRVPGALSHPSTAATTTSTGTASTVDSRIASRASTSPTR